MPVDAELWNLRERLRLARDHMSRAQLEMERALIKLGPLVGSWYFCVDDPCSCGVTTTVSTVEIYGWLTSLSKRCSSLFDQSEAHLREPLVELHKRGSRRRLRPEAPNWLEWRGHIHQIPETELPKITPAPKESLET